MTAVGSPDIQKSQLNPITLIKSSTPLTEVHARAAQGDSHAQFSLGFRYAIGQDVPLGTWKMERWARVAAELMYAFAQHDIGLACGKYQGVPQDYREAVHWSRLAEEHGHAGTQYNLGWLHAYGQGVPQDDKEATRHQ